MMLLPVQVSARRRVWVDVSISYEKQVYAGAFEDLTRYILKQGHVDGVYEDEEIADDVRRTCCGLLRTGAPTAQVVEEVSAIYGIPEVCVEEIIGALPVEEIRERETSPAL